MAPFQRTTLPAHLKHPAQGRPTAYRPEYDELVIEFMGQGFTLTAFAGHIGVARDTVYQWVRAHASFSDALNRAHAANQLWWERKLQTSKTGGQVAASIFGLKNRASEDWKEVREVKHQHEHALRQLTDAQLHAIASQKATDAGVIEGEYVRTDTPHRT